MQQRAEDALAALNEALGVVNQGRAFFYEPELLRLKGLTLLQPGPQQDNAAGEASLREALALARTRNARSLVLRVAMSLAQLDSTSPDLHVLREIYGGFTEGLQTPDLVGARRLLKVAEAEAPAHA